jgi:Fic family protein
MDVSRFSSDSPGDVISIGHGEHAFIPQPLLPNWTFPAELWPLLAEAKQQIGILEGIGRNLPNPAILLRPLEDREAIRSSSLEGTYATPRELLLFELDPKEASSARDPENDHLEVFNYRKALLHGVTSELPLSLRLLRDLHRILMTGVRGKDKTPGEFRKQQVAIGSSRRFVPPPPERLMDCLDPLEKSFHDETAAFDPLVQCFLMHYQFETIHPFNDGNGRVGRLLLAIMLQQKCQLTKPWLYLSEFYERYRDEYVQNLFNVSADGDWNSWIEFCLRGTVTQAQETITRCERLLAIRELFTQRVAEVGGSIRLSQIVDDIFYSPFVRVAALARRLGVTYPTAKADLERLVQAGILHELPLVSPKTYYAPEVYAVAYEELAADE